jgi:hypothetical protein
MLQAYHTELLNDEAYYWKYSTQLDWGYFDHPPLIALLIKLGYSIFNNELGVRLFIVLLNTASIYIFQKIIKPTNQILYFAIILAIAYLHIGGIIAAPDAPLIFFSGLFYFGFKKYLYKDHIVTALMLAAIIALLLYSKYHGILIIGLSILSNITLLKRKTFWICVLISIILYIPHILWQVQYGFPSVTYHFLERSKSAYDILFTLNYLVSIPFVFGPLIGLWLVYSLFSFTKTNQFEKTLFINAIGVLLILFLLSFKGNIEGNWLCVILFPLLYFGVKHAESIPSFHKGIYAISFVSVLMIIGGRILLIHNFLNINAVFFVQLYNNKLWANQITQVSKSRPVAFMNSYQLTAKYEFYSQQPAFSLNNIMGRKNQYTIWDSEYDYQGKDIMLITNFNSERFKTIITKNGDLNYVFLDNFHSYGNVSVKTDKRLIITENGKPEVLQIQLSFSNSNKRNFIDSSNLSTCISYVVLQQGRKVVEQGTNIILTDQRMNQALKISLQLTFNLAKGDYDLHICTKNGELPSAINSPSIHLRII